jgi:hypothetical protein
VVLLFNYCIFLSSILSSLCLCGQVQLFWLEVVHRKVCLGHELAFFAIVDFRQRRQEILRTVGLNGMKGLLFPDSFLFLVLVDAFLSSDIILLHQGDLFQFVKGLDSFHCCFSELSVKQILSRFLSIDLILVPFAFFI